jgi:prephenate dehydrogenase
MTTAAPRAHVAGLGLIGGSIGMALRARGWHVSYDDPHVDADAARRAGAADEPAAGVSDADIVVIATPVDVALEMIGRIPSVTATSVCSVMVPLRSIADERNLPFVAGHPMAGSQERGLAVARADLFNGRTWFVDREDALVSRLIADCGAKSDRVDAELHDRAVALTSHLPQLLSTALGALIDEHRDVERFAGTGLATFLRLAGSDASVWRPLFEANRENVSASLDDLMRIVRQILDGDPDAFAKARAAVKKLGPAG